MTDHHTVLALSCSTSNRAMVRLREQMGLRIIPHLKGSTSDSAALPQYCGNSLCFVFSGLCRYLNTIKQTELS